MLARDIVAENLRQNDLDCQILALPVPVAALMSPEYIANTLKTKDLSKIDLTLIPGLIKGDASRIEEAAGIKTRKGPKNAADLPSVLKALGKVRLSTRIPADDFVRRISLLETEKTLSMIKREAIRRSNKREVITIGAGERGALVSPSLPMLVLAEIVDASIMPADEIQRRARDFAASDVDIIDIGMVAGGGHPEEAARAVRVVKGCTQRPVSIDTSDPEEIASAVRAGADLILSINAENMNEVKKSAWDTPVVVTSAGENHRVPASVKERLKQLNANIKRARKIGFKKIIADPVLNPLMTPSLAQSISGYMRFRELNPRIPLLFGAGNVTELMDADSIGANLLLAGLAAEVGANILLTTEASNKTKSSARELARAVKMVTLARARRTAPEDLGINLLVMKEKRCKEEPFKPPKGIKQLKGMSAQEAVRDLKGSFRISVDRRRNELLMIHYSYGDTRPDSLIRGSDPDRLIGSAIRNGMISRLEHASYLGKELQKARIALETGKSYVQDQPLLFASH